jgi:hypothetical protein
LGPGGRSYHHQRGAGAQIYRKPELKRTYRKPELKWIYRKPELNTDLPEFEFEYYRACTIKLFTTVINSEY